MLISKFQRRKIINYFNLGASLIVTGFGLVMLVSFSEKDSNTSTGPCSPR